MKKQLKVLALILSVLMVLTCTFTGTVLTVSAEEETPQTLFSAVADFSLEKGNPNGVWSYESRNINNPDVYTKMTVDSVNERFNSGIANIKYSASDQISQSRGPFLKFVSNDQTTEAVLTFTAPYSGFVNVYMSSKGVVSPAQSKDAARFELLHNGKIIESCYDLDNEYHYTSDKKRCMPDSLALFVNEGDTIRFAVGRNKVVSDTDVYMTPVVKYANIIPELSELTYDACDDFSLDNNPNGVWNYQMRNNGNYTDLADKDTSANWWKNGTLARVGIATTDAVGNSGREKFILLYSANDTTNDSVLTFTAPYSGNITINTYGLVAPNDTKGGVHYELLHNNEVIDSCNDLDTSYNGNRACKTPVTANVKAGDKIRFVAGRNATATTGKAYLSPVISYNNVVVDTFDSCDDFSLDNNPNGVWSYQMKNNGNYTDLTDKDTSANWWRNGTHARVGIATSDSVGGSGRSKLIRLYSASDTTHDSVLAFTAPYSGNITINTYGLVAPNDSNDGVHYELLHNSKVIDSCYDLDTSYNSKRACKTPVTVDVKAGDKIRFVTGRNSTATNGTAFLSPVISYNSILEDEEVTGKSYYVSASGSDANTGTNEFAPWQRLSKLANIELKGGDRVYLKAGDTFNGQLVLNNVSGTKENPVVITSYGTGDKPVIDLQLVEDTGTAKSELAVPAVLLNNAEGVEISGLKVTGTGVGIDLHYENTYNHEYVKIANCDFENINGFNQADERERGTADRYYLASAITVTYNVYNIGVKDPAIIGLYIDNCKATNCGTLYVNGDSSVYNTNESGAKSVSGLFITNCDMVGNDYYGAFINGVSGGYMDGCTIDKCGDATEFEPGTAGLLLAAENFIVQNTTISEQKRGGVNYDGVGIDFEKNNNNVIVRNCYIKDNLGAGILFFDSKEEAPNINCQVINNIFENNASAATGSGDDKNVDIRIVSKVNYALSDSVIKDNIWCSDQSGHTFIYTEEENSPAVANTIKDNTKTDDYDYQTDSALTASVMSEIEEYIGSDYTADVRKEFDISTVSGEIISAITYKHSECTADSTVWGHKYFLDGEWNDMDWNGSNWTFGTEGKITTEQVNTALRETGAIVFNAPKAGRIKISMEGNIVSRVTPANWDGVTVTLLNGNNEIISDSVTLPSKGNAPYEANFGEVYYNVAAGESVYIAISKNASNAGDPITIKPVVEYIDAFGSIDDNDGIDLLDLVKMKKHLANNAVTVSEYADIDGDGQVVALDLAELVKYLLGIIK